MKELELRITKETGKLLASIRKNAHLTQKEVGERIGFSSRSGRVYVSRLERGEIENPSLWLILKYLTICEKPWSAFFEKLAGIYFNKQHVRIMTQIAPPMYHKKIDRDVAKYTHSIKTKFSNKQEIKPLTQEKKAKMAVRFGRHRAIIEPIEKDVTYLLGNSSESYLLNPYYKAFAREIYSTIRKIYTKARKEESTKEVFASSAVNDKFNRIIEKWVNKGLKREILEQVKEIPIRYVQPPIDTDNNSKIKNQNAK